MNIYQRSLSPVSPDNGRRISHKRAAIEAEVGRTASSREYDVLMVAVILPINGSARANLDQRRDELVILGTHIYAFRRARRDLNCPVHRGAMNRTVIVNNLCFSENETEQVAMSETFALKCNARAARKLMNKYRNLMVCARGSRRL